MWKYEPVYGTTKNLFGNHHINIQQYENDEGKWFYKIEIDGEIILERENEKPQQFKNVKFYASDPWYPAWTEEYGVIEHLKINNGMYRRSGCKLEKLLLRFEKVHTFFIYFSNS